MPNSTSWISPAARNNVDELMHETLSTLRRTNPKWFLLQVEMKGMSGPIEFKEGRRIQFKLDLLKLKQHSLVKVRRDLTRAKQEAYRSVSAPNNTDRHIKLYAKLGRRMASRRWCQRHRHRSLLRTRHQKRNSDRDYYTGESHPYVNFVCRARVTILH